MCNAGFRYEKVYKIFKDLIVQMKSQLYPKQFDRDEEYHIPYYGCHKYFGSVSISFDEPSKMLGSEFIITLKKTNIFDEENVVIGRVVKGLRTLQALNEYGTKFGMINEEIFVSKCA